MSGGESSSWIEFFVSQGVLGVAIVVLATAWFRDWIISKSKYERDIASQSEYHKEVVRLTEEYQAKILGEYGLRLTAEREEKERWRDMCFTLLPLADNAVTILQEHVEDPPERGLTRPVPRRR
jgi:hypothetical protein